MRLLVTGASGQLGAYLLRELVPCRADVTAWTGTRRGELFGFPLLPVDLQDADAVTAAFRQARPDTVVHTVAMASVADCNRDPAQAHRINVQATAHLADLAAAAHARLVHVSTDLVFDGARGNYQEADSPAPLSVYGRTKRAAERTALIFSGNAVVRVSLLFGPSLAARPSFFDHQLTSLRQRQPLTLFLDEWRTPLSLITAARALLAVTESDFTGLLHLGGPERLSRLEMGQRLARHYGLDSSVIRAVRQDDHPAPEPRPRDVSLDSSLWRRHFPDHPWPRFDDALTELFGAQARAEGERSRPAYNARMDPSYLTELALLSVVALLIGVSKAGFGGGTGILVGPLLAMMFPAKESVALMLPLLLACDIVSLYPYWRKWDVPNVRMIMPGALVGIVLGACALGHMSDYHLKKTIGVLAIAFAVLQVYRDWIVRSDKALVPNWWHGSLVGLGTGFVSTLSHVGGALTTMYLIPQRLDNERFVGTTTALYFLVNVAKFPVYIQQEMLDGDVFMRDLPLLPFVALGTMLGVYLNRRVPGRWFTRVVLIFVLLAGIHLLVSD